MCQTNLFFVGVLYDDICVHPALRRLTALLEMEALFKINELDCYYLSLIKPGAFLQHIAQFPVQCRLIRTFWEMRVTLL